MRGLLCLLLAALFVGQLGAQPSVTDATYKVKQGQALQLDLELAEYELTFGSDVHRLELQDCPGATSCPSTPDPATCPPCNYASHAYCGNYSRTTTNLGCSPCTLSYCSGNWIELDLPSSNIQDYTSLTSLNSFVEYRVFVPEAQPYCNSSLFFRLATIYGDADIYVSATPVPASDILLQWPWCSARGRADSVHICPTDYSTGLSQSYAYAAGTYFVYIVGNLAENAFNLSLSRVPLAPPTPTPQDMTWCASQNGTLLVDGAAATWTTEAYKCLQSDVDYDVLLNDPDGVHHFIARVEGGSQPCKLFGISHTDFAFAHTIYISFSDPFPSGLAADANPGTIIYSTDYPRRVYPISFCPTNFSQPTYVYITIEGSGQVRLFSTSNRARFTATRFEELGSLADAANSLQEAVLMRCPASTNFPVQLPCVTRVGLVGASGGGVANGRDCQGPFLLQNGQPPRALYRPPPFTNGAAFVDNRFSLVLVKSVSTFTGLHQLKQEFFSDAVLAGCYPDFYSGLVVDVGLLPVVRSPITVRQASLPCEAASFSGVKAQIDTLVPLITEANATVPLLSITSQLDSQNLRDAYVGCSDATQALLVASTETTSLQSTDCLFPSSLADPCCNGAFDWNMCCLPRTATDIMETFSAPTEQALATECEGPACVLTFLSDYITTTNYGCSNALIAQEAFNRQSYAPWITCSDTVFGPNLAGAFCLADTNCSGGACDTTKKLCVNQTYDALVNAFLSCLINDQPGLVIPTVIRQAQITASTTAQTIAALRTKFAGPDCTTPSGLSLEVGTSGVDVFGDQAGCVFSCQVNALFPFFEAPLSCHPSGGTDRCGGVPGWAQNAPSQSACEARNTCNWFDCVAAGQGNTQCNTTCMTQSGGVCAACLTPKSCFNFATVNAAAGANVGACASTSACQLADGTWAALDPATCVSTFRCTHPCWNGTALVPCADAVACQAAGECSDTLLTDSTAGVDSACILNPQPYHLPPCTVDTAVSSQLNTDSVPLVFADRLGCILHNLSQPACLARTDRGGRYVARAHTAAACAAHGCGCEKPTLGQNLLRSTIIGPSSDSTSCAACSPKQECTPYATWTQAQWLPGSPRPLVWQNSAALVPAYTYHTDAFNFAAFGTAWMDATTLLYNSQAETAEQCRFNRIAAALEAVSCGCGANGDSQCYADINTGLPIGIGAPCAGAQLTLSIPPHTFDFAPTSVTPAGSCLSLIFRALPRSAFAKLPRGQSLSTYFTNLDESSAPKSFEFRNLKGAIVGQVIGDGVTVESNGVAQNVAVCLDFNTFYGINSQLRLDKYTVFDFALVDQGISQVTPMAINTTLINGGYCAVVANLTNGTYAPIIRYSDWANKNRPGLTKGEKAVFFISAACYAVVLGYACWHLVWIIIYPVIAAVWLTPPFWLCCLFGVLSLIRMIYLILLGAEQIRSSNVGNMVLVEAPTFIWFSSTTLVVFLWVSVTSTKRQKHVAVIFRRLIVTANGLMWGLFILFIILFVVLKDKKHPDKQCQGRLGERIDQNPRRILFIVYQVFLALVALLISFSFLFYGTRVYRLRSKLIESQPQSAKKGATTRREERHLLALVIVCSFSFAAHAVLLLVLALVDPGIPYLVLILVFVEVLPTMFVLWGNPSPRERRATVGNSLSRGTPQTTDHVSSVSPTSSGGHGEIAPRSMRRWVEGLRRARPSVGAALDSIGYVAQRSDEDSHPRPYNLQLTLGTAVLIIVLMIQLDAEGRSKSSVLIEDEGWTLQSIRTRWRYYMPVAMWLPSYDWRYDLPKDLLAGLAVATMLIPQALSYAALAKLPPEYGLYTAWAPLLVYFFLGTSKQLSIGPDALGSLLVGLTLESVSPKDVVAVAHVLSLIAGLVLFLLGAFRFGFLDNILSRPLLCGFINALAVYIIIEQSDTFLGLPTVQVHGWEKIVTVIKEIRSTNILAFFLGCSSLAIMIFFRVVRRVLPEDSRLGKVMRAIPDMMFVVILFELLSYYLDLQKRGVRILGELKSGFPVPSVPQLSSLSLFQNYLPSSIIIGVLGFVESILVAKIYARRNGYMISPNRELVAFGAANIIGAFFQAYPTFGSLTRSAVAQMYGARSQVYGLVVSIILLLTMLVLGPLRLFYYLPKVAMSGIVLVAASSLFELEQMYFLFKIRAWPEVLLAVLTFLLTFVLGVDTGILISLAISVFLVIRHSSLPHLSILGRTPDGKFRDVTLFKDAQMLPGIMLVSIEEALHFANIEQVKEMLIRIEKLGSYWAHPSLSRSDKKELRWHALILNCKGVPDIDAGAMQVLAEMVKEYSARGTFVCFAKLRHEIKVNFERADIIKSQADPRVFASLKEAVGRFVVADL